MRRLQTLLLLLAPLTLSFASCGGDPLSSGNCDGAKCDELDVPDSEVPDSPCDGIMHDKSGRNNNKVAGRLHDPLAQMIWNSEGCPTSYQDIMQRLREVDTQNCDSDERAGIATRAVSETAQITGDATSYRLVTTRTCGDRTDHEIIFSLFGVRAGSSSLPSSVEVMAFDKSAGVYNFYDASPGEITFFGNSKDMKKGAASGSVRKCAACHTGGGLVMKELDTPWLHWEGHMDTPGASELIEAHPDLGTRRDGADMEFMVKDGNDQWNQTRLQDMQDSGTLADVLRPLFCTVEVNTDNGADFEGNALSSLPVDSLLDPQLKSFDSLPVNGGDYDALKAANGQEVPGTGKDDTVFAYPFVERSHIDNDYVNKLVASGLIDQEFVKDVLMVDFTRPIFSDDRCDLLSSAPQMSTTASADEVRQGFIDSLQGAADGTPEFELLTNLMNSGGHDATVDSFLDSCKALPQRDLLENAMEITSLNRRKYSQMSVFEGNRFLVPSDNLSVSDAARLHPTSCSVTSGFVPVAVPGAGGASLTSWTPWNERNSSNIAGESADHTSVSISGSGSQGFNGGAFQQICGVSGKTIEVSATTSWSVSGGTRWTQIFVIRDGSLPQNGVDVLESSNVKFSPDGSRIFTDPTGDCVTVLLKAGSTSDGAQTATFDGIVFDAFVAAG